MVSKLPETSSGSGETVTCGISTDSAASSAFRLSSPGGSGVSEASVMSMVGSSLG